jgi:integrase/recombinase XerD
MNLSNAMDGFFFTLKAEGYSQATVDLYRFMLTNLSDFLGNREVADIGATDLTRFFAYLRAEYPQTKSNGKPLAGSTLQNHWKAIRRFFRWAEEELGLKSRPDIRLKLPPNNPRAIMPLSEEEVKVLLDGAEYSRDSHTNGRRAFRMKRPTAERDTALIVLLLDTGIRAGEASRLDVKDVDLEAGEIFIAPYGNSKRKTKSRVIPLGKVTRRALWRYISTRPGVEANEPLFLTMAGRRLNTNAIRLLLTDLGRKARVNNAHPHRLRHTFAVEYLRNDGDIFTLQMILGHSTLDMVRNYLQLAKADAKNVHLKSLASGPMAVINVSIWRTNIVTDLLVKFSPTCIFARCLYNKIGI